jgi:hypothetical protein
MTRSPTAQKFIHDDIDTALARAGLEYDHPVRDLLDAKPKLSACEIRGPRAWRERSVADARRPNRGDEARSALCSYFPRRQTEGREGRPRKVVGKLFRDRERRGCRRIREIGFRPNTTRTRAHNSKAVRHGSDSV